ncbi:flagellar basal body-associated FliL family protein [Shewanella surugensis]|uniref:Flagellar protein FliL n=1 Tax=Shewanella surugensis TaxID=212020 RepID=A0ABT0L9H6_9GAMM|nr:flagellar basal body-associated FliL family protein [Shewanella surugensis]MCL1124369.1 flagellar basal body-associated FliL family protein [Shewanella surugensis]
MMAEEFLMLEKKASTTGARNGNVQVSKMAFFKSKSFVIGISVTGTIVLMALLTGLLLGGNTRSTAEVNGQSQTSPKKAFYVAMPRPFLFNLSGINHVVLVEIKVQLMVRSSEDDLLVRKHIPLIEDALLTTFSSSDLQRLSSQSGKDEMRQLALRHLQNTLQPVTGQKIIEKLLFTGFIIQ